MNEDELQISRKHHLALQACVRGADDAVRIGTAYQLLQNVQLLLCGRIDFILSLSGYGRKPFFCGEL